MNCHLSDASYHLKMFFSFWLHALIRPRDLHWLKKTVLEKAKHSFIGSCIKHYHKPVRFNNSQQKVLPFLLKDFLLFSNSMESRDNICIIGKHQCMYLAKFHLSSA